MSLVLYQHPFASYCQKALVALYERLWDYYRDLMARPSVARVVDEARPWRDIFPLPWPADIDELDPVRP